MADQDMVPTRYREPAATAAPGENSPVAYLSYQKTEHA